VPCRLVSTGISLELGRVENGPAFGGGLIVAAIREKEIAGEQGRPSAVGNEMDRQIEFRVGASGKVHEVTVSAGEVFDDIGVEPSEGVW
jgi:hypothetical protein